MALFVFCTALAGTALSLHRRWREESHDRRVAIAVEWNEYRDFSARLAIPEADLLAELKAHGVSALVMSPGTLSDWVEQHKIRLIGPSESADPLDVRQLRISDPVIAAQMWTEWNWRNIPGLQLKYARNGFLLSRTEGGFAALKDADAGFDAPLIQQVQATGLVPVLRVTSDAWLPADHFKEWLDALPASASRIGVLFSSDELPGGLAAIPVWRSWLINHHVIQFLPEFHPAPSSWQMAHALPSHAYRAHSISAAELKDLKPAQQQARWHRAVEERSCRLLLVRMAAGDSRDSFLSNLSLLSDRLRRHGWQMSFPEPRLNWAPPPRWEGMARPMLAFLIICLAPAFALRWGRGGLSDGRACFLRIVLGCLMGALVAAAVAQTPDTRLQIIPFRGVKYAFLFSWLFTLFVLYDVEEMRQQLSKQVRRWDLVIGGVGLAVVAYLVLRTGNAPASWKPSWEQSFRDLLESALVARPRFKEFAIGHPLLWVGCCVQSLYRQKRILWDGRALVWIGMIGPISMINTFCHLHSPLYLELLRSCNGVVLGVILGSIALSLLQPWIVLNVVSPRSSPKKKRWLAEEESHVS